jgi:glycosyltransferase involved in cell wall biosynthesis
MGKKKVLFIGDGITPTGFSTVVHNIIGNLPKRSYDVHHIAVNYRGDPHDKHWNIYPAVLGGDYLGMGRLREFANKDFDGIFILNDPWVIQVYLEKIKETWSEIPPIVVYFPVDSIDLDLDWFKDYNLVKKVVVYTKFGYNEVKKVIPNIEVDIIPHGIDTSVFYRKYENRVEAKKELFPEKNLDDSFIVLNANRNQPRKRIDITIQGFSIFAKDKPPNVMLYLHMGIKDMGWDIIKMSYRYGIDHRLILTNTLRINQSVSLEKLNAIYNACDVGLNTAIGEGWSLTNMEHAVTGAPQIVPGHSALEELYFDNGLIVPVFQWLTNSDTLTISGYVHPQEVADRLNELYANKDLYKELSRKTFDKWNSEQFSWEYIAKNYWVPLLKEAYNK